MYRGRPPPRGDTPSFDGRGPPPDDFHHGPGLPHNRPPYQEDTGRPAGPPVHHGYQDHGPPDPYKGFPGSDRRHGNEVWSSGPPRDTSMMITVDNERPGPGTGHPPNPVPYNRDYPPKHAYDGPDNREPRRGSPSRGRSRPRSRSPGAGRSKSRARSHSRSPDRSRARSRAKSKSRVNSRSRSRSPDRSRGRSRAKSKSRLNSRSRSRSPDRSRARSRARSKSRPRSQSRSPDRSKDRSRAKSRPRSRSRSGSPVRGQGFKELDMARRRKEVEQLLNMPTKSILKKRLDSEDSPLLHSDSPRGPAESTGMSWEADRFLTAVKGMEPNMMATMLRELRDDPHMAQRAGLKPENLSEILGLLGGVAGDQEDNRKIDIEDEEKFLYGDEDEPPARSAFPTEGPDQHSMSEHYGGSEAALYGDFTPHYEALQKAYGAPVVASPQPQGRAGSGEHTPRSHQEQVGMRYRSITPEQNIKAKAPQLDYPSETGSVDKKERHEVEQFEKIQDLLKTIGLDLGVTEISKMAARTKERLQEPSSKTPTRYPKKKKSRRDSSSSSSSSRSGDRRKSHSSGSGSSSSSSRSRSRSEDSGQEDKRRKKSPSSERRSVHVSKSRSSRDVSKSQSSRDVSKSQSSRDMSKSRNSRDVSKSRDSRDVSKSRDSRDVSKSQGSRDGKTEAKDWGGDATSKSPDPKAPAGHPAMHAYPQAQPHGMMTPNYPPPGYDQYGNYMPYMPQQWPMYPPHPSMSIPPPSPNEDFQNDRPNLKAVQTQESATKDNGRGSTRTGSSHERSSEEKNIESQKQKVLEEREKCKRESNVVLKKKDNLMKELNSLKKQQEELHQEKRHNKDPLLTEISRLQKVMLSKVSVLRKEHEAAEKKRSEIEKLAVILGLKESDRPQKGSRALGDLGQPPSAEKGKNQDQGRSQETSPAVKPTPKTSSSRASLEKMKSAPASAPPPVIPADPFEYYDAGNHWCQDCNVTTGSMFDFFTHLHCKSHRKTQDPYSRPWAPVSTKSQKDDSSREKMVKPAKGAEFLLPVKGFFCSICEAFYGDAICAEEHVTSHPHNEKYKKRLYENPLYEQKRNLDRLSGGGKKHSELKRKHEDERESEEKEEDSKHIKKEEEQKAEVVKLRMKEEEEKRNSKKREEESLACSKRDDQLKYIKQAEEEERYKHAKEEKRQPSRKEGDDRNKYRREEEERSRYGRGDDERYKHSGRDVEDERSRYSKGKEPRSRNDRRDEAKYRSEREEEKNRPSNRDKAGQPKEEKPGAKAQTGKPSEKQSGREEAGESVANATPVFGKFTWKKKEDELAKKAEAAKSVKEGEAKASEEEKNESEEDLNSVALAKSIAIKLSGRTVIPPAAPAWVPYQSNRGRIRPNLPAPAMQLRKSIGVFNKPAPLNTFLNIRPPSTGRMYPVPMTQTQYPSVSMLPQDIISKAFGGQEVTYRKPEQSVNPVQFLPPVQLVNPVLASPPPPTMSMRQVESDVGVPGVPECDQNRAVLAQPPPSMARYSTRSEKPKSNLAAAKAQDLFDIFYSSSSPIQQKPLGTQVGANKSKN